MLKNYILHNTNKIVITLHTKVCVLTYEHYGVGQD
jgi:hypothetical protein